MLANCQAGVKNQQFRLTDDGKLKSFGTLCLDIGTTNRVYDCAKGDANQKAVFRYTK